MAMLKTSRAPLLDSGTHLLANLGCGNRYHASWWNCDFAPTSSEVMQCDLSQGIPLPEGCCQVVYHSHVLEHFSKQDGVKFLRECMRVLRPGGVIRVVVPDLEGIAKAYIASVQQAEMNEPKSLHNHSWMVIEMLDQCVREHSGGAMQDYLQNSCLANEEFVLKRLGEEARGIIQAQRNQHFSTDRSLNIAARIRTGLMRAIALLCNAPEVLPAARERTLKLLLGSEYDLLKIARFRSQGQIHRWMYDRISLRSLLSNVGFEGFVVLTATKSSIPNWMSYQLDTLENGTVIKPDSIYVEAVKPLDGVE